MSEIIKNRYDFVIVFDVKNGNPNGDPDAGNMPRIDPETGRGLVSDVCLKRKIRNYVQLTRAGQGGYDIFVKEKAVLNDEIDRVYAENSLAEAKESIPIAGGKMCSKFFDVRTFGAVMSTGKNAGQVRGPVQITFAQSVDPIVIQEHTVTRVAITKSDDAAKKDTEMGRKFTVPYGLYVAYGFVSPSLAAKTGFSEDDLALLWEAIVNMFEHDRSAARGLMVMRNLFIFKHSCQYGNAPAHKLFDLVQIKRKAGVDLAREYSDYDVAVAGGMPANVELIEK